LLKQHFESALAAIPSGYGEGVYEGLRYGVTVRKSRDGKRTACSRERSRAATARGFARAELSAAAKDQGTAGISRTMEYDFSRLERGRACGARSA